jgi:hypothetical protein
MQWQFRSIRKQKYDRCKEIEAAYRLKQHTNVKYPKWIQPSTFGLVTAAFIAAWSWVIWEVVH